ncbi:MAG: CPBP family intramembrane metalloprotease [Bryobacterales bacterium]|nr:CPBP family intramembrane metalloprotease [Bryobacterales bacterium]
MRLRTLAAERPLFVFFAIAYTWAWLLITPLFFLPIPIEAAIPASFGPTIAAVVTHRLGGGTGRPFYWYAGWQRLIAGCVTAVGLTLVAFVIVPSLLLTDDPGKLNWAILGSVSIHNYTTLLGGPIGEEPGWRGYALPRLQQWLGPTRAALVLGLFWAFWHLPLWFAAQWNHPSAVIYLLLVTALSVFLAFGANVARFAVIPAILGHAAFNTVGQYLAGMFQNVPMSNQNAFWKALELMMRGTGLHVSVSVNGLIAGSGVVFASLLLLLTRGRLAQKR